AVGNYSARQGHTVHDRSHAVLANSEMEVAAGVVLGREAWLALDDGVGGAGQIGGATHQLGDFFADGVDDHSRRGSAGDISILGGEGRQCVLPAIGKVTGQTTLELF